MQEIAKIFRCSLNKIKYWMEKHNIPIRSIGEAIYIKHNPKGDPFKINKLITSDDFFLFGLGLGLYWGEGNKANKISVRIGNSDPALLKKFIEFLFMAYNIKKEDLRVGLQIFSDINPNEALKYWIEQLKISKRNFQKVIVTPSRGVGTYRKKSQYGVITLYYHNRKLRDILGNELKKLEM